VPQLAGRDQLRAAARRERPAPRRASLGPPTRHDLQGEAASAAARRGRQLSRWQLAGEAAPAGRSSHGLQRASVPPLPRAADRVHASDRRGSGAHAAGPYGRQLAGGSEPHAVDLVVSEDGHGRHGTRLVGFSNQNGRRRIEIWWGPHTCAARVPWAPRRFLSVRSGVLDQTYIFRTIPIKRVFYLFLKKNQTVFNFLTTHRSQQIFHSSQPNQTHPSYKRALNIF
jgi:hypothetical protein